MYSSSALLNSTEWCPPFNFRFVFELPNNNQTTERFYTHFYCEQSKINITIKLAESSKTCSMQASAGAGSKLIFTANKRLYGGGLRIGEDFDVSGEGSWNVSWACGRSNPYRIVDIDGPSKSYCNLHAYHLLTSTHGLWSIRNCLWIPFLFRYQ